MSTDPKSMPSADQFIELLGISNFDLSGGDARGFIGLVWSASNEIWKIPQESWYTNHDLNHSFRILQSVIDLDPLFELSPYERMVICAASCIHDIGMQFNFWAPKRSKLFPPKKLGSDELRERHSELGHSLIKAQLKDEKTLKFPQQFVTDLTSYKNALNYASYIGFSHSGTYGKSLLNSMLEYEATFRAGSHDGFIFRPRLLAALLRICDELDNDSRRIGQPDRISTRQINNISAIHWLSCLFIKNVDIEISPSADRAYVSHTIRVPFESDRNLGNNIQEIVRKIRILELESEIETSKQFLEACGERSHLKEIDVRNLNPDHAFFIPPKFDDLQGTIKIALELWDAPSKEKSLHVDFQQTMPHIRPKVFPEDLGYPLSRTQLSSVLRQWFTANVITGHIELISGLHTDTYVNCRFLAANPELLRAVSAHITDNYIDKDINCIMAVGTSAIPFAVNIAIRLGCKVTFTFSRTKLEEGEESESDESILDAIKKDYSLNELLPSFNNGDNLLILDDIISGGRVAKESVNLLVELKLRPGTIHHFSLYRLGSIDFQIDKRITSYDHFVDIPEVLYALKSSCPLCEKGFPLKMEREMF